VPVVLRTDRRGRILAVVRGEGELARLAAPGGTLTPLIADAGAAPLLDFLLGLRRCAAGLALELPAAPATGGVELHFAGLAAGEASWIAVAAERADLLAWCRGVLAEAGRDLDPRPTGAALERLGGLVAEIGSQASGAATRAVEVASLERMLAEKDREIAELRLELDRLGKQSR
jgi:hypothetical protein